MLSFESLAKQIEVLIENKKLDEAEKLVIDFLGENESSSEAANNLAVIWIMKGEYNAALDIIQQILDKNPTDEIALENLNYLTNMVDETAVKDLSDLNKPEIDQSLSIIIPIFNKKELTLQCLKSINKVKFKNKFEVIIIDNASTDNSYDEVISFKENANFEIEIIRNENNLGFSKANNLGAKRAKYSNLLFLNNDTIITNDFISAPLQILNNGKIGIVGIKLLYPDNLVQHAGLAFKNDKIPTHIFRFYPNDYPLVNNSIEVSAVTGACLFIRKDLYEKVDGFDEIYVNGSEDVDLCLKVKKIGYKIWYEPKVSIYHLESQSEGRLDKALTNKQIFLDRWKNYIIPDVDKYYGKVAEHSRIFSNQSKFTSKNKFNVAIKICVPTRAEEHKNWGDIFYAESLSKSLEKLGHNVVINYLNEWQQSDEFIDVVIHIKGLTEYVLKPNNINIMWIISHPELHTIEELNRYDLVFIASEKYYNSIKDKLNTKAFFLPQATALNFSDTNNKKEYDILFVGNNYEAKNNKLRQIIKDVISAKTNFNLKIFGNQWDGFVDEKYLGKNYVRRDELPELYSKAKIILNDHQIEMKNNGFINDRTYDIAQTKSMQISNDVEGLEKIGVETYSSVEELEEKLNRYLNDEKLRLDKATENFNATKTYHFENRAKTIFDEINNLISNNSGVSFCNICNYEGSDFLEMGIRTKVRCPKCNSLERQRALWFLLNRDNYIKPEIKVLEIAPLNNVVFRQKFEELGCNYVCIDKWKTGNPLDPRDTAWIDFEMDICDLKFEDSTFDLVIMQHVIEEVPDDRNAFSEIARVLKTSGHAILEIPHDKWLRKTIEYDGPQKFGNLRKYGVDFYQRTKEFFIGQEEKVIDGVAFSIFRKLAIEKNLNFPVLLDHPVYQKEKFTERFHKAINSLNNNGFITLTTPQVENLMYENVFYNKPSWITLDDGRIEDLKLAQPILTETGNVATSYLIPSKIDESLERTWKENLDNKRIDIQNHSLNHKQVFTNGTLKGIFKGENKYSNLLDFDVIHGYPIFEYSSGLAVKQFLPANDVIDFCTKFYEKNYNEESHDEYLNQLSSELSINFPDGLGKYENDKMYQERLELEINYSNEKLSNTFDKEIYSFSFPWGTCDGDSLNKAKQKHTLVSRVYPSRVNHSFNPFTIDRIEIEASAYKELENSLARTTAWENLDYKSFAKVAVLMTTYNRKETLADSIGSIVNQTFKDWNLIIVNDGGEDVNDIVSLFNDPRIKLFTIPNGGKAKALNFAIENSDSKYVAYLDDDDKFHANHLDVLVSYIETHSETKFVYSMSEEVTIVENNYRLFVKQRVIKYAQQVNSLMMKYMNFIPNLCVLHSRELFNKTGLYDEKLKVLIDWDMYRRLILITEPKFINEVTSEYIRREKNGNNADKQLTGLFHTDKVSYYENRLHITSKEYLINNKIKDNCIIIEINNSNRTNANYIVAKYEILKKLYGTDLLLIINCKLDENLLGPIMYAEQNGGYVISNSEKANIEIVLQNIIKARNYNYYIFFNTLQDFTSENLKYGFSEKMEFVHFSSKLRKYFPSNYLNKNNISKNHVSIVIPTFNNWTYTKRCLKSINRSKNKTKYEIIIVDNGSTDQTRNELKNKYTNKENFTVLLNEENLGFAKANNIGVKNAKNSLVLFLNNDTEVKDGWLDEMVNVICNDEKVGIVGAKLFYPETNLIQHAGVAISDNPHPIFPYHIYHNEKSDFTKANFLQEYQVVTGACLLISKKIFINAGMFDENFINGYEDVDLCFKIRNLGYKVMYTPKAKVIHYESKSEGRFNNVEHNVKLLHQKWEGKIIKDDLSIFLTPKVSIIIPVYNQLEYTKRCIKSIKENTHTSYELIIVNNASTDNTDSYLDSEDDLKVISNNENVGYPKAINQGLRLAKGENVVLLNNDTVLTDGWLERMIEVEESNSSIGIVGVVSNSISGIQIDNNAKYKTINEMHRYANNNYKIRKHAWIKFGRVAFVCVLITGKLLNKIGGLDEQFSPGNFEDDDFCLRAQLAGFQTIIATDVFIHHYGSVSFSANGELLYTQRIEKNKNKFVNKWGGTPEDIWLYGNNIKQNELFIPFKQDDFVKYFELTLKNMENQEHDKAIENLILSLENYDQSERTGYENITKEELLNIGGNLSLLKNDFEEAKQYFELQLESNPNSSPACFGLGEVFYKSEMFNESKTMYEWAVVNNNNNKNAHIRLNDVNKKLNLPIEHNSVLEETLEGE